MRERYRLQGMKDDVLIATLPKLVQRDNEHAADLLAHLGELDARRLYEDMGFHSMWEYCIEALGLCQTTAWRKYTAARVCRRFPAAFEAVARGEIHVSVLAELNRCLTNANAEALLACCKRKSFRDVQQLLAARFPQPDAPDSIRRVPQRARPESSASESALESSRSSTSSTSDVGCERSANPPLLALTPTPQPPSVPPSRPAHRQVEPLSLERFAIRFTADAEFLSLLEEVRALDSHRVASGDLLTMLKSGLHARRRELLKERFAVGRTPRANAAATAKSTQKVTRKVAKNTRRAVSAEVARLVYERDEGRCSFVSADGRRCSARRRLQIDHVVPHAIGGADTPENLRLLCQTHNLLMASRYFGGKYMRSVSRKRARAECA